ncbi:outer membrane beta-barrel protein [Algoriphagus sp. Y33]|uniref:outer membrane beta-barrel protein n=1 Tax=Algoriphagus sp. Y33 TaxID=2772483 RepID=UPI00177EE078|nr:outer membrane beta-barrel protein [Algoriphagus sp. Y33]
MKEDKLDKEIAASLKKKLAEASVPYQLGAWEAFQKKRALRKRKTIAYWASGVAASLVLLAVGLNSVDFSGNEHPEYREIQMAESIGNASENEVEEITITEKEAIAENSPVGTEVDQKSSESASDTKAITKAEKNQSSRPAPADTKTLAFVPDPTLEEVEKTAKTETVNALPELQVLSTEKPVGLVPKSEIIQNPPLIAKVEEKELLPLIEKPIEKTPAVVEVEETVKPIMPLAPPELEKERFVAENDFPVIPKDKATVGLGMGLSPGFGAIQSDNQVATASTIGLGMLVDVNLPGKFTLGSGLGLNYLNQNAKQESTVMAFGNTYPQTEKLEVRQMQVELPVFVKYPLTRSNSISIQAGFSNFYALNETASQENTVERQMAVYNSDASGFSSVTLKQQAVTESATLEPKNGRFYPFATLNFGLNLRVLETKGANYVIMPFYNYQVRQVSGYGDTYGLFGASFKVSFGGGEK